MALHLFSPVPLKTKKGHGAHVLVASCFPEGCQRMCPTAEDGTGEKVLTDFRFGSLVTVDTAGLGW